MPLMLYTGHNSGMPGTQNPCFCGLVWVAETHAAIKHFEPQHMAGMPHTAQGCTLGKPGIELGQSGCLSSDDKCIDPNVKTSFFMVSHGRAKVIQGHTLQLWRTAYFTGLRNSSKHGGNKNSCKVYSFQVISKEND